MKKHIEELAAEKMKPKFIEHNGATQLRRGSQVIGEYKPNLDGFEVVRYSPDIMREGNATALVNTVEHAKRLLLQYCED